MKITPDALLHAVGATDESIIEKTAPRRMYELLPDEPFMPEQPVPDRKIHRIAGGLLTAAAAAACITAVLLLPKIGKEEPSVAETTAAVTTVVTTETTTAAETTQTTETAATTKKPDYDTQLILEIDQNDNTAYVKDCSEEAVSVIVPKEYLGRPVTWIRGDAFDGCSKLEEITVPDTVKWIQSDFEDTPWLKKRQKENPLVIVNNIVVNTQACKGKVEIPEGVTSFGGIDWTESKITELTIPGTVKSIGEDQFACFLSLKKLTIGAGLEEIEDYAFSGCTNLTEVVLSDGLKRIGKCAFSDNYWWNGPEPSDYCKKLKIIKIPESVTEIGADAFEGTPWLEDRRKENPFVVVNGILIDGWNCKGSITIPDTVKTIGDAAFYDSISNADIMFGVPNTKLTSVIIPDSVTKICDWAFANCSNLASVTLPESLTSIGDSAFGGCGELTDIRIPAGVTELGGGALTGTKWMEEQQKKSPMVIVNGILIDGSNAKGRVSVPDGVTVIGKAAFMYNDDLKEVILPDSVTSIGDWAFECSSLSEIILPNKLTSIGERALRSCNLQTIVIPDSVTSIGAVAFDYNENLEEVVLPAGLTVIEDFVFSDCKHLKSIRIPDGVIKIGKEAFGDCRNLKDVYIPASVTDINGRAFYQTYELEASERIPPFIMHGEKGSCAEQFAKDHSILFIAEP